MATEIVDAKQRLESILKKIDSETNLARFFYEEKSYGCMKNVMRRVIHEYKEAIKLKEQLKDEFPHPFKKLSENARGWLKEWHENKIYARAEEAYAKEEKIPSGAGEETPPLQHWFFRPIMRLATAGIFFLTLLSAPLMKNNPVHAEWLNDASQITETITNAAPSEGYSGTGFQDVEEETDAISVTTSTLEQKVGENAIPLIASAPTPAAVSNDIAKNVIVKINTNYISPAASTSLSRILADETNEAAALPAASSNCNLTPATNSSVQAIVSTATTDYAPKSIAAATSNITIEPVAAKPQINYAQALTPLPPAKADTNVTVHTNRTPIAITFSPSNAVKNESAATNNQAYAPLPATASSNTAIEPIIAEPQTNYSSKPAATSVSNPVVKAVQTAYTQKVQVTPSTFIAPAEKAAATNAAVKKYQPQPPAEQTSVASAQGWSFITYVVQKGDTPTSLIKKYQNIKDDLLIHTRIEQFNRDNPSTKKDFISFQGGRYVKNNSGDYEYVDAKKSPEPDGLGDFMRIGQEVRVRTHNNSI